MTTDGNWLEDQLSPDTYLARARALKNAGSKESGRFGVVCPVCLKEQFHGEVKKGRIPERFCQHKINQVTDVLAGHDLAHLAYKVVIGSDQPVG